MDIPSNCHIEIIERTITDNGIPTVLDVDRCVPEVSRNTLSVSVYGNTTKLVFARCTAAEGVSLRAVHEFNLASGYIAPDDDERKRESKRCSISRTKRIVTELVASNTWEWFITITLDASKWNRHNPTGLQECIKEFFRTIRNTKINGKNLTEMFPTWLSRNVIRTERSTFTVFCIIIPSTNSLSTTKIRLCRCPSLFCVS